MEDQNSNPSKEPDGDDVSFIRTVSGSVLKYQMPVLQINVNVLVLQHYGICCLISPCCCAQEDIVCLVCTSGDTMKRGYLAAEGFGSQLCHLEPEPKNKVLAIGRNFRTLCSPHPLHTPTPQEPSELWKCTFQLEDALSVHAMYTQGLRAREKVLCLYASVISQLPC